MPSFFTSVTYPAFLWQILIFFFTHTGHMSLGMEEVVLLVRCHFTAFYFLLLLFISLFLNFLAQGVFILRGYIIVGEM
jgi:hypothetical protein